MAELSTVAVKLDLDAFEATTELRKLVTEMNALASFPFARRAKALELSIAALGTPSNLPVDQLHAYLDIVENVANRFHAYLTVADATSAS